MADISKIKLPSGSIFDIKDDIARKQLQDIKTNLSAGMHYIGTTTTELYDNINVASVVVDGQIVIAKSGDIVIYGDLQFIATVTDTATVWHEFGSTGSLKALAFKQNATGPVIAEGSVSQPTFSGNIMAATGKLTPEGDITISTGTGTANYTPAGTLSGGEISVELNTADRFVATSATSGGVVNDGSAAQCTLPTLTTSVTNETLTIDWGAGSFTPNTPTTVTLPIFQSSSVAISVKSATITTEPTFTGTGASLAASFAGKESDVAVTGTPTGTVSQPTFTGSSVNVTVS